MNNKCTGIWIKASEKLPDEYSEFKIRVCGIEFKDKARYSEGHFFSKEGGKLLYTIQAFEWLDESIKEDKPVEGITDEEIEAMAEKEFPVKMITKEVDNGHHSLSGYEFEYDENEEERNAFIKGYKAAIRDKLSV